MNQGPKEINLSSLSNTKSYICYGLIILFNILPYITTIPVSIQLFVVSLACLYTGCYRSVSLISYKDTVAKQLKKFEEGRPMTTRDALLFPVYGSAVLGGCYLLFKFVPRHYINFAFTVHFTVLGYICVTQLLSSHLHTFFPSLEQVIFQRKLHVRIPLYKSVKDIEITKGELLAAIITVIPTVLYAWTKHWLLNNVFGVAFSISGIQSLTLPNFKIGLMLLWALFFYDIFWVYGTDVMVTVAKSIDAPIKLFFPVNLFDKDPKFSMLGLGDIVIPGVFVALCLKFDVDKVIRKLFIEKVPVDMITPYFNWCYIGYASAILVTFQMMAYFQRAQPALLYLVPGCTLTVMFLAFKRQEMKEILNYDEEFQRRLQENAFIKEINTEKKI